MFEVWQDVTSQIVYSAAGPTGFDVMAVKEVVQLAGYDWDQGWYKRMKVLEQVYMNEMSKHGNK